MQLPEAYRSLSRPSSAPDAKAFALCSFSLELPIQFSSLELLEFLKQDHFFALKRFFPFRVVYPPFGEIVSHLLMHYPFWKDSINFSIFVLFNLFVSLTHSSKFKFEFFRLPIRLSSFICIAL